MDHRRRGPDGFGRARRQYVPHTLRCTPEFDTAFGIPKGVEEKSVAIGPVLGPTQYFDGGTCPLTFTDGTTEELPFPPPRGHKSRVVSAELRTAGGETTRLRFEPPAVLHLDNNEMRCFAFQDVNGGTAMTQDVVLVLPRRARFEPASRIVDISGWYATEADQQRLIDSDQAATMFAGGHWTGSFYEMTAVMPDVQHPVDEPVIDTSAAYMDADRRIVRSTTGQLAWDHSGRGFITVDTPGTKAMIGHGGGGTHVLGEVTIEPRTPYCLVYVTAPGKDDTIADAPSLLISATDRMLDRGTVFDDLSDRPLVAAPHRTGPVVLEPVVATVELKRQGHCRVFTLDHGGRKNDPPREVPIEPTPDGWRFALDRAAHKTHYYVAEFEARCPELLTEDEMTKRLFVERNGRLLSVQLDAR